MTQVLLFHSALGVRAGITELAEALRAAGHSVEVVDQYERSELLRNQLDQSAEAGRRRLVGGQEDLAPVGDAEGREVHREVVLVRHREVDLGDVRPGRQHRLAHVRGARRDLRGALVQLAELLHARVDGAGAEHVVGVDQRHPAALTHHRRGDLGRREGGRHLS